MSIENHYFKVYDNKTNKYLEPIYKAYEGKLFDYRITPINGSLSFRCLGMEDEGFPDGNYHESVINEGDANRFRIEINKNIN